MKLNIGYRVTVNLGNYESFQYNLGVEIEIPDKVSPEKVKKSLENYLENEIKEKVMELRKNGREKYGFDTNTFEIMEEDND